MDTKYIALSFDDGPSNVTSSVLDILERFDVPATFFLIGENVVEEKKSTMARQIALGCELCNHSLTHSHMPELTADEVALEITETTRRIETLAGVTPKFFRPPFIETNDIMYDVIDMPFICGIDSVDWDSATTVEKRIENVLSQVVPGAIILMHDFDDNTQTVKALPTIISELKEQGYEFVTISKLFEVYGVDPKVKGKIWSIVC
ncbi:MAG: polysaccharide deacetylase family protein [Saccharofermentans sp.]|nr:polysaccharide deacetylase family protein [Saccharofermentans sp.]